jgi:hypothetical protein
LRAAENVRDGLITEGFSIQLRNAEAHTSYRVQEWGVRILRTDGGTTDIPTEELVDSVLAGVETLRGIYFGTVCAMANAGIDLEELPDADVWKLTTEQRIGLVLATFRWDDVTISRVAERLVVEGTGEFPKRPLSLAGACLASLKTEATTFELRGSHGRLEGPIEPMVEHEHAIDDLQREASFVKCARLWTFDGEPVLSCCESACKPDSVRSLLRGDHPSGADIAAGLGAVYPGLDRRAAGVPALTLLRVGFAEPPRLPGMLVGSYPTVSPLPVPSAGPSAVCSLLHFPSGHPAWVLPSTLPCGVRTFLGGALADHLPRSPGELAGGTLPDGVRFPLMAPAACPTGHPSSLRAGRPSHPGLPGRRRRGLSGSRRCGG